MNHIYINIKYREINIQNYVSWLAGQTSMGARLIIPFLTHIITGYYVELYIGSNIKEQT